MFEIQPDIFIECYKRAEKFKKADEISIIVGLIITPILFFGIGISVIYFMSAPLSYWVGYSIIAAGGILFLFILVYRNKLHKRKPHILIGKILEIIKIQTRFGESASILKIKVSEAYIINDCGKGNKISKIENKVIKRLLVLKHFRVEEEVKQLPENSLFLCAPNGQIIGYVINEKLTEYVF